MKIQISILSDYLQPNFLLIKEFENKYDKLVFITTNTMESPNKNKSYFLAKALNYAKDFVSIINIEDDEDNYANMHKRLNKANFSRNDEYILNLTGGTKIIPMAVYNYFKDNNFSFKAYYVPIGKNIIKGIAPDSEQPIKYKMSLKEYFDLQGLQFETTSIDYTDCPKAVKIFKLLKSNNYNRLPTMYSSNYINDNKTPEKLKKFLCGEWFEEYCYNRLKTEQNIPNNAIVKGARIFKNSPDEQNNEVDVMFVKDNNLYFFECKVIKREWDALSVNSFIYKLAAITKNYGLRVNSYLLTLSDMDHESLKFKQLKEKTNLLGIKKVFGYQDFEKNKLDLEINQNFSSNANSVNEIKRQPRIIKIERKK